MSEIDPRGARPTGARPTGAPPAGARDRIVAARARLARELAVLAEDAAASAMERCPYRGRHDVCFFGAGCRNRRYDDAGAARCAGGTLDTAPAAASEVAEVAESEVAS